MHVALNYLDRILSKLSISRRCYQLVATACICIAAKFEEQPHNIPSLSVLSSKSFVARGILFPSDTVQDLYGERRSAGGE
mmetsp:Transcript_7679/g.11939  ORF Transcript_7679/g.11939 Transcript_7679/m.11939 type:complete len:80 (-) Transcript_7679:74-313(-)